MGICLSKNDTNMSKIQEYILQYLAFFTFETRVKLKIGFETQVEVRLARTANRNSLTGRSCIWRR